MLFIKELYPILNKQRDSIHVKLFRFRSALITGSLIITSLFYFLLLSFFLNFANILLLITRILLFMAFLPFKLFVTVGNISMLIFVFLLVPENDLGKVETS